jgi:heme oxygenase
MATTAYSRHYAREIDVEQLAGLLRGTQPISAEQASDIDLKFSEWIRSDIQCSSCGRLGAQVVRSARARGTQKLIRQSHFRFVGQDGQDAHHPTVS